MSLLTDDIHSFNSLIDIDPRMVAQFFAGTQWTLDRQFSGVGQLWSNRDLEAQIMLPLDQELRDFDRRFSEVLATLGDIYGLSGEPLALEIISAANDIFLLRADQNAKNGTIPLNEAKKLLNGASSLIESAACSAVRPRPTIRGRRPSQVVDFLEDGVRMGHTMRGSFVITILAELNVEIDIGEHAPKATVEETDEIAPFSRLAFSTLATGVRAARELASQSSVVSVDDAISAGVTAELLEALENMGEIEGLRSLDLRFKWGAVTDKNQPPAPASRTKINKTDLLSFDSPIETLRRKVDEVPKQIIGYVRRLERAPDDTEGTVIIEGNFDAKSIKSHILHVPLAGQQYSQAIRAHETQKPVVIKGVFERKGRSFWSVGAVQFREVF